MSTFHSKLPKIINLIDEVDIINFEHTSVGDASTSSSGEFIISEGIDGENRIIRVTHKEDGHHPDSHFIIMDDTAKILLEGEHLRQKCFQKVLNVYSPVGFILGSVRERNNDKIVGIPGISLHY